MSQKRKAPRFARRDASQKSKVISISVAQDRYPKHPTHKQRAEPSIDISTSSKFKETSLQLCVKEIKEIAGIMLRAANLYGDLSVKCQMGGSKQKDFEEADQVVEIGLEAAAFYMQRLRNATVSLHAGKAVR